MTEREWIEFEQWLDASWRPGLDAAEAGVYRAELGSLEPAKVMAAARAVSLKAEQPGKWRPKPMEIVAELHVDAGRPTFDEAYRLLFDSQRGALCGRRSLRAERFAALPPLVAEFARRQGQARLLALPLDSTEPGSQGKSVGEWARHNLEEAWDRHVQATGDREVVAITTGTGMRQLDPLAALGIERPSHLTLVEGDAS